MIHRKKKGRKAVRGHLAPPDVGMIRSLILYCTCCASVSELMLLTNQVFVSFLYQYSKPVTQNGSAICILLIWPQKPFS